MNGKQLGTTDLLEQLQVWSRYRHHREKYPLTRAVLARLQASPQSLRLKSV